MNLPDPAFLLLAAVMTIFAIGAVVWPLLRSGEGNARGAAFLTAIALPIAATVLYTQWSTWPWLSPDDPRLASPAAAPGPGAGEPGQADVVQMVNQLEQRLMTEGGSIDDWRMLGRSKLALRDYPGAAIAYQQVNTMTGGSDAQALTDYAEALFMSNPQSLGGTVAELVDQALALDETNPKALWYGGLVSYDGGEFETAISRWESLLSRVEPERNDIRLVLTERIGAARQQLGLAPVAMESVPAPAEADGGVAIEVILGESLATTQLPAGAPMFILARAPGGGGPPFAVARRSVDDLPLAVTLSDADAMLPGRTISSQSEVEIVARVALSGQPVAQSGDLFGSVMWRAGDSQPVRILIDQVAP